MAISPHFLQEYLYQHIPISKAMGVAVREVSQQRVVLSAPLSANINHKKTVFGGSLQAVATLACWSLAFANVGQEAEIVISASEIEYLCPVTSDFIVTSILAEDEQWQKFKTMLIRKGKARIKLNAHIYQNNRLAVTYQGSFVAIQHIDA